jgi:hypothetical protein
MFDPVTIGAAMSTANLAFSGIKRAFMAGRQIEEMGQDLSRWMGAVSDVSNIEKRAKNPPFLSKVFNGQSIESEAIEAFSAAKKLQSQREELKTFLMFTHGTKAWDELLAMEGQIRKRRQKEIYERQERRDKIVTYTAITIVLVIGIGILSAIAYGLWLVDRSA